MSFFLFFFNDTATTEIYTLSLHDALPILHLANAGLVWMPFIVAAAFCAWRYMDSLSQARTDTAAYAGAVRERQDRKSTRLNSSHANISYAVFCLKKKKKLHLSSRWQGWRH